MPNETASKLEAVFLFSGMPLIDIVLIDIVLIETVLIEAVLIEIVLIEMVRWFLGNCNGFE
ncbi:hypothetical protein GCM10007877_23270 [Marinibactrum halimedae]|uniref:Transmembrane protein n=1 Tax=Marinibactrum halimedae TaxID=1444977 RepID=A0AA37T694_9GAMM|nr:hypothetical protein GCM10007877_23270 [Marinibactrum halimedae]